MSKGSPSSAAILWMKLARGIKRLSSRDGQLHFALRLFSLTPVWHGQSQRQLVGLISNFGGPLKYIKAQSCLLLLLDTLAESTSSLLGTSRLLVRSSSFTYFRWWRTCPIYSPVKRETGIQEAVEQPAADAASAKPDFCGWKTRKCSAMSRYGTLCSAA